MIASATTAAANATPWVLDPVAAGPLAWRTELALTLLEIGSPAVIRGNASETLALGGGAGAAGSYYFPPSSGLPSRLMLV
jgi:hydroxyethylthiazole kinase